MLFWAGACGGAKGLGWEWMAMGFQGGVLSCLSGWGAGGKVLGERELCMECCDHSKESKKREQEKGLKIMVCMKDGCGTKREMSRLCPLPFVVNCPPG